MIELFKFTNFSRYHFIKYNKWTVNYLQHTQGDLRRPPFPISSELPSLRNKLFSGATRPMCSRGVFKWIHLLRLCSCDDLTFHPRSINGMLCLNWIKFSSCGSAFICNKLLLSSLLASPYRQLNAPVTCVLSLDWTCRDGVLRLPYPTPT